MNRSTHTTTTAITFMFITMLVATPFAAATQHTHETGSVDASSPLYGLEVAFEQAAVAAGIQDAGEVALERADEADKASQAGDHQAATTAAQSLQNIAEQADERHEEELDTALQTLKDVKERTPDEANKGLETAIDAVDSRMKNLLEIPKGNSPTNTQERTP